MALEFKRTQTLLLLGAILAIFLCTAFFGWGCLQYRAIDFYDKNGPVYLRDVVHDNVPDWYGFGVITDATLWVLSVFVAAVLLFDKSKRKYVFKLPFFMVMLVFLFFVRFMSICSTLLPSPNNQAEYDSSAKVKFMRWFVPDEDKHKVKHSHDFMYSGHTLTFAVFVLFICKMYQINISTNPFPGIAIVLYAFLVTVSREHYTVDVILAVVVTMLLYFAMLPHEQQVNSWFVRS